MKISEGRAMQARWEALLGDRWGMTSRLARAMNVTQSSLHRVWAGQRDVPEWMPVVIELLESTPPVNVWPKRWQAAYKPPAPPATDVRQNVAKPILDENANLS